MLLAPPQESHRQAYVFVPPDIFVWKSADYPWVMVTSLEGDGMLTERDSGKGLVPLLPLCCTRPMI
ncbi:MAG: hypothetical protein ACLQDF_06560 [Desulfomonilia bacterium]